ncbi:hypothetical protein ACI77I_11095 [Pseudomonas sp. D47]|uniref:hypothetical protein n=1 Tax=Pseudomonas sp. D47 TaxID=3159447 RepID=UPI00387A8EA9
MADTASCRVQKFGGACVVGVVFAKVALGAYGHPLRLEKLQAVLAAFHTLMNARGLLMGPVSVAQE